MRPKECQTRRDAITKAIEDLGAIRAAVEKLDLYDAADFIREIQTMLSDEKKECRLEARR